MASVCKHTFVGGQIPLLDVGVGRTGVHIRIKYCGTYNVTLMSSAKWGSLPYSPDPTTNSETTNPNYAIVFMSKTIRVFVKSLQFTVYSLFAIVKSTFFRLI